MENRQSSSLSPVAAFLGALALAAILATPSSSFANKEALPPIEVFEFDKGHTEIRFQYDHLGMSKQSGEFREFDGEIRWNRKNIEDSSAHVVIEAASLSTGYKPLDDHLKSADFFEVAKYPKITFRSTRVRQTGADSGKIIGELTIHGVTKSVTLDVKFNHYYGTHPIAQPGNRYFGAPYAGFSARAQVLRSDFGLDLYVPGTSDRVEIVIETELRRKN